MILFLAVAVFVGSEPCRPCHTETAEAYARTPMARSSGRVESVPPAEVTAAGQRYRIAANRLAFDQGSAAFDYFIGSNSHGRSYLFEREGFLFELPVTWYASSQAWDASPGYEKYTEVRLDRPVERNCLLCHASQVRFVRGTQNRYGDPPFADNGVGCERCHGPGSEHVRDPVTFPMVTPAELDPERRDAVCIQCHLSGVSRVARAGRRLTDFHAGERLADYVTYFVWDASHQDLKVTSHVERLAASGCKRAAGDKLWCGTCHEPHTNADRTQAACLGCHSRAHHAAEQCASCHMPKFSAADAGHGVFTDHSIPRDPAHRSKAAGHRQLVPFLGTADARALGIAYAEAGDPRARGYLLRAQPADAAVLLRLAVLEQDSRRAAALYEGVLREEPGNPTALVNLGALYAAGGRTQDAARLWRRALETNPAIEGAALNLSQVLPTEQARAVLVQYLGFNPGSRAARSRLAALRHP
ncbi:MAG: tetratricopeptide repeat protein [Acidobacteriia bacterium]|nr:tetratricopeptide repeat protein [Terriglobia bacterium]